MDSHLLRVTRQLSNMRRACVFLAIALVVLPANAASAWSAGGHHLIAIMAFRQLTPNHREELLRILKAHPRFDEDFEPPTGLSDTRNLAEWFIGRAGYWPDVIRRADRDYHRSTWHYELGATLAIGDQSKLQVPGFPGPLPVNATLETQDLHIAQALELCLGVLAEKSRPDSERAIALCWIAHLVADAHQPCHAGSLYTEAYPGGDRGGNSIKTRQRENLHSVWDGLLGDRYNTGDILRRAAEIENDRNLMNAVVSLAKAPEGLNPQTWLSESRAFAKEFVYTSDVLRTAHPNMEPLELSDSYLKAAGYTARTRAASAATRLAAVWLQAVMN